MIEKTSSMREAADSNIKRWNSMRKAHDSGRYPQSKTTTSEIARRHRLTMPESKNQG